jgi:hypothetical protein
MRVKKKKQSDRTVQTQIRMSLDLKERIRKYQAKLRKETGVEITFTTAVRALLEKGLTVG